MDFQPPYKQSEKNKEFFVVIADYGDGVADIDENAVDTNLVFVKLRPDVISTEDFIQRMEEVPLPK